MIKYKDGNLVDDSENEVNKENENGYAVTEHGYPHDTDIWYTEDYEDADSLIKFLLKDNPNRKFYVREITNEEVNRFANMMAAMI